jgi:hypothetical protein
MDGQVVEILGRQRLIADLLRAGLEVALPIRDHGIDLIAYADRESDTTGFRGCPIQMKASVARSFVIDRKYSTFPNLILAFVWNVVEADETVTYALRYQEALTIAQRMGYAKTDSWRRGTYVSTQPSRRLLQLLKRFEMSPARWRGLVVGSKRTVSLEELGTQFNKDRR